jgi:hypothetical protein
MSWVVSLLFSFEKEGEVDSWHFLALSFFLSFSILWQRLSSFKALLEVLLLVVLSSLFSFEKEEEIYSWHFLALSFFLSFSILWLSLRSLRLSLGLSSRCALDNECFNDPLPPLLELAPEVTKSSPPPPTEVLYQPSSFQMVKFVDGEFDSDTNWKFSRGDG